MTHTLGDFDFALPPELIAQFPVSERTASRLLVPATSVMRDLVFRDIATLLQPGDLLVFNQTRVVKARLFGEKASGGKLELLIERVLSEHTALAHIRASKSPKAGSAINVAGTSATIVEKRDALYLVKDIAFIRAMGHVDLGHTAFDHGEGKGLFRIVEI